MPELSPILRQTLGQFASLLEADDVIELSANQDGKLFVERAGAAPQLIGELPAKAREQIVRMCASDTGQTVTAATPIVSARMKGLGYRFEGLMPPAVDAPTFSIRFHNALERPISTYVDDGTMTAAQAEVLLRSLKERRNILVAGGTSSGKTTLLNSLLRELARIAPEDRLVVLEDTPELQPKMANVVLLRATAGADMTRLLASTLRLRPDRIIVGEVRDGAALALLK
ncbi:conjugal transfer protein TrbB, partial [Thioclava sp. BHET1]